MEPDGFDIEDDDGDWGESFEMPQSNGPLAPATVLVGLKANPLDQQAWDDDFLLEEEEPGQTAMYPLCLREVCSPLNVFWVDIKTLRRPKTIARNDTLSVFVSPKIDRARQTLFKESTFSQLILDDNDSESSNTTEKENSEVGTESDVEEVLILFLSFFDILILIPLKKKKKTYRGFSGLGQGIRL